MSARTVLPKVFVSYSESESKEDAILLKEDLATMAKARGYTVSEDWVFVASLNVKGGASWYDEICTQARDRKVFILLISPGSLKSPWCIPIELWLAQLKKARVIPMIMDGTRPRIWWNPFTWRRDPRAWEKVRKHTSSDKEFKEWCKRNKIPHKRGLVSASSAQAVPRDLESDTTAAPISSDRARLWTVAVNQVFDDILADEVKLEPGAIFRCDQTKIDVELKAALEAAKKVLVLMLVGTEDDRPQCFLEARITELLREKLRLKTTLQASALNVAHTADSEIIAESVSMEAKRFKSTSNSNPELLKWHVGNNKEKIHLKHVKRALGVIAEALHKATDSAHQEPRLRLILIVVIESNITLEEEWMNAFNHQSDTFHATVLPAFEQIDLPHFESWLNKEVRSSGPNDSSPLVLPKRFQEAIGKVKQDPQSRRTFAELEQLCRDHHLIHDQP